MSEMTKTPNGVPVFHADHGLTPEHLAFIDKVMEGCKGFFISVFPMPEELPDLQSALYGPSVGDAPVTDSEVVYEVRGNRPGPSRLLDRPTRPCRRIVVCGIADGAESKVFTAYGTQAQSPAPREWWDSGMKPHEAVIAAQFWCEHALAREG
jgi:hypothetical protein